MYEYASIIAITFFFLLFRYFNTSCHIRVREYRYHSMTFFLFTGLLFLTAGMKYFSSRQCVIFGGFFVTISLILSSFAQSVLHLIFTHSVLMGNSLSIDFINFMSNRTITYLLICFCSLQELDLLPCLVRL